jgi:hypothetical protein
MLTSATYRDEETIDWCAAIKNVAKLSSASVLKKAVDEIAGSPYHRQIAVSSQTSAPLGDGVTLLADDGQDRDMDRALALSNFVDSIVDLYRALPLSKGEEWGGEADEAHDGLHAICRCLQSCRDSLGALDSLISAQSEAAEQGSRTHELPQSKASGKPIASSIANGPDAYERDVRYLYKKVVTYALTYATVLSVRELYDLTLNSVLPFDVHLAFWRERADYRARKGSLLSLAWELAEGGPMEWVWLILPKLYVQQVRTLDPVEKVRRLSGLQLALLRVLGYCKRSLLSFAACRNVNDLHTASQDATTLLFAVSTSPSQPDKPILDEEDLVRIVRVLQQLNTTTRARVTPLEGRSMARRYWLRWTVLIAATAGGTLYLLQNRERVAELSSTAVSAVKSFYVEHLAEPVQTIVQELFGKREKDLTDEAALKDANDSLKAMLRNFNNKVAASSTLRATLTPELQNADFGALAKNLDMRAVSERFVIEMQNPIWNGAMGDLVEMMLIQIAFIKKEVLSALGAMDDILAENRFNLQLSAMIPAFLVLYAAVSSTRSVVSAATAPIDTSDLRGQMRLVLRDIHRLLTLAEHRLQAPASESRVSSAPPSPERQTSDGSAIVERRVQPLTALSSPVVATSGHSGVLPTEVNQAAAVLWSDAMWEEQTAEAFDSSRGGSPSSPPTLFSRAFAAPINIVHNIAAIGRWALYHIQPKKGRPGTKIYGSKMSGLQSLRQLTLDTNQPPAAPPSNTMDSDRDSIRSSTMSSSVRRSDYLSMLEMSVHPNPAYRINSPDPAQPSPARAAAGKHMFVATAHFAEGVQHTVERQRSDNATAAERRLFALGSHVHPGLLPEQLGHLTVLLRRMSGLLRRFRSNIAFGEWLRVTQDLHDIVSAGLTNEQRLASVQRLMTSYSFLNVSQPNGWLPPL